MTPQDQVNAIIWLVVAPAERDPALARMGYTRVKIEVQDQPRGLLPIDVVVSNSTDGHAFATECKAGLTADAAQWARYVNLRASGVSIDFGSPIGQIECCYMIRLDAMPAFCLSLRACQLDPGHIPLLAMTDRRIHLPGPGRFRRPSLNHIFTGSGAALPEVVPSYVDVLPNDSQRAIRRFVLQHIPALLRVPGNEFTASMLSQRSRVWAHLSFSAQAALVVAVAHVLADLRNTELNGWIRRSQGDPSMWRVYRHAKKARGQQVLAQLLLNARARWEGEPPFPRR